MHRQELKELDALHSHLARFEGVHSVARGFEARCEAGHAGPDGWVDLTDTYKETVGRRYVQSHGLLRVESEKRWQGAPPRTATLQGGHSDMRTVCCGARAHDIDCENGDCRLICSLATQTGNRDLVPAAFDYVWRTARRTSKRSARCTTAARVRRSGCPTWWVTFARTIRGCTTTLCAHR